MGFVTNQLATAGAFIRQANGTVQPTLRAVPPPTTVQPGMTRNPLANLPGLNVKSAMVANLLDKASIPAPAMGNADPSVGQAGSAGDPNGINGARGNLGYMVQTFGTWQASNPMLATALRIGLPVVGVLAYTKGHHLLGGAAILAAAPLWYARLKG